MAAEKLAMAAELIQRQPAALHAPLSSDAGGNRRRQEHHGCLPVAHRYILIFRKALWIGCRERNRKADIILPKNDEGEFELVLGNRQLISVFLIVVILLGVFFSMGYIVGRNSSPGAAETARNEKPKPEQAADSSSAGQSFRVAERATPPPATDSSAYAAGRYHSLTRVNHAGCNPTPTAPSKRLPKKPKPKPRPIAAAPPRPVERAASVRRAGRRRLLAGSGDGAAGCRDHRRGARQERIPRGARARAQEKAFSAFWLGPLPTPHAGPDPHQPGIGGFQESHPAEILSDSLSLVVTFTLALLSALLSRPASIPNLIFPGFGVPWLAPIALVPLLIALARRTSAVLALAARRIRRHRLLVRHLLLDPVRSRSPRRHGPLGKLGNLCALLCFEGAAPGAVQPAGRRVAQYRATRFPPSPRCGPASSARTERSASPG